MPEKQLSWQPGFSLTRKPAKRPTAHRKKRRHDGKQQFEFVVERPVSTSHPRRKSLAIIALANLEVPADARGWQGIAPYSTSFLTPIDESDTGDTEILDLGTTGKRDGQYFQSVNSQDQPATKYQIASTLDDDPREVEGGNAGYSTRARSCQNTITSPNLTTIRSLANVRNPSLTLVSTVVKYSSLSERFKPILDRYNSEFCTIPLTFDLIVNPFRYHTRLIPEPIFLVHAVMALAGHHVDSPSALHHRHAALRLLRESIDTCTTMDYLYSMLDTIIILFSLDETQSALGTWKTHLMGAYGVLEACGSTAGIAMSVRLKAQVGILTWWDAIICLLSRERCVFPYAYFEAVLSSQVSSQWDFFGLCGCPKSLVKIVMQMARLSNPHGRPTKRDVVSHLALISELEQSLESWHHISALAASQDEESMQKDHDIMHCSEAWRNGLLLYMFRVFHWQPGSSIPMRALYRARIIVDHVVSCRDVSMVSRQALLPLFFAGCELRDRSTRRKIIDLCSVWNERTRYHVFHSAIPLLEQVWAEQENLGAENVWWGQVVDRQHATRSQHPLRMSFCFG